MCSPEQMVLGVVTWSRKSLTVDHAQTTVSAGGCEQRRLHFQWASAPLWRSDHLVTVHADTRTICMHTSSRITDNYTTNCITIQLSFNDVLQTWHYLSRLYVCDSTWLSRWRLADNRSGWWNFRRLLLFWRPVNHTDILKLSHSAHKHETRSCNQWWLYTDGIYGIDDMWKP